jgi:hypothetical protein
VKYAPHGATVVSTLRWAAEFVSYRDAQTATDLTDAADQLEHALKFPDGLDMCCPVCEEMRCDEGCPVLPLREHYWTRSDGTTRA